MDSYSCCMETINREVAQRIAATILNQNRSKKSVAEAAGIPVVTFSRKLNDGANFTITEVARIADALGVHPGRLFPQAFQIRDAA